MSEMTGPELCERTFESDPCRQILMTPVAFWEHGAPFARGQGAYGVTFALYYTTGIGVGRQRDPGRRPDPVLPRARRLDPDRTRPSTGSSIEDGRATGVVLGERSLEPGAQIDARVGVLSNAGVPETLRLVGEETRVGRRPAARSEDAPLEDGPARLARDLVAARPSHRLGLLRLRPADQRGDPRLPRLRLLGGNEALHGGHARQRHLEGRGSAHGVHLLRAGRPNERLARGPQHPARRGVLPLPAPRAGRARGLGRRHPAPAAERAQRDDGRAGPRLGGDGARPVRVDAARQLAPEPLGEVRPGGRAATSAEDQWILDRMPYRMPLDGLYMSNGVWPVGLSWMAAGYNAAQTVAEDAGVREQPWWSSRPVRVVPAEPRSPAGEELMLPAAARYDVAIVGSGPNGLTAAAYLARAGARVVMLEKRFERGGTLATDDYSTPFQYNLAQFELPLADELPPYRDLDLHAQGVGFVRPEIVFSSKSRAGRRGARDRARGQRAWEPRSRQLLAAASDERAAAPLPEPARETGLGPASRWRTRRPARSPSAPTTLGRRSCSATPADSPGFLDGDVPLGPIGAFRWRGFQPGDRGRRLEEPRQRARPRGGGGRGARRWSASEVTHIESRPAMGSR